MKRLSILVIVAITQMHCASKQRYTVSGPANFDSIPKFSMEAIQNNCSSTLPVTRVTQFSRIDSLTPPAN